MGLTGMRIVMAVGMLPVLPIFFGVYWFLAGEKDGTQFGVTLWQGAKEQPKVQEIKKKYQKELKIYTLISLVLFLLALLPEHESLIITGMMVWVFFVWIFLLVPFQRANSRMKERKREFLASQPREEHCEEREEILIDVTAAGVVKMKHSRKSIYAGCVFGFLAPAAEVFFYEVWRRPWLPDLWLIECILLSLAGTACLFPLYLKFFERQRIKVFTYNSQVNLQVAEIRRYHLSRFCTSMAWLTGLFNWGILCSFHVPYKWFPWMVEILSLLFGMIVLAEIVRCFKKIEKHSRKYLSQELPAEEDDDKYWICGMIYYNKNDARTFVEPRVGFGFTANMAKPAVKYTMIAAWAVLAVYVFGACGWSILEEFTPVSLAYEDGTLTANHWKKVYQIEQSEIKQAILLEEEPDIRRQRGTGMKTVKKGDFYSDTYRQDFKVCINPQEPPFLMIESSDGGWYLLGGSDGEATRDIVDKIRLEAD